MTKLLEDNLVGVRKWCPGTAARIEEAGIPEGFGEVVGTDGTRTFAREVGGKVEWLGGTSMPRSSAKGIVKSLDAGVCGLGLSIGSGFEWGAFARRLRSELAVFVYERDAGLVRMALSVCDLSEWLAEGKIILLAGEAEDAAEELSGFLGKHVGFEVPAVLHPLPTLVGERRNLHLAGGEMMVRRVILERQGLVGALASRWKEDEKREGVVGFTKKERYAGDRPLHRFMEEKGIRGLRVDRYEEGSAAGRLRFLLEERPGKVVSDLFRVQLGCVPAEVGVETWVPPLAGAGFWEVVPAASNLMEGDRVVVQGGAQAQLLEELGFGKSQIEFRAVELRGEVKRFAAEGRKRVAVIGDLAVSDAEGLGVVLPTHQAVFAAAREIVAGEYLSVHVGMARDVLRRAMARAGVADEKVVGESMLRMVRNNLIAAVPMLTLVGELQREGVPLRLIGDWRGVKNADGVGTVVEAFKKEEGYGWEDVAVLAHLSPWGVVSPIVGEAIGAGVAVMGVQHGTDLLVGSLASLLKPDVEYARSLKQNFLSTVKQLLKDAGKREAFCDAAVKKLAQS